jgi:predicted RNA binding protein YcfA (HicA-like mRNA interferase family)
MSRLPRVTGKEIISVLTRHGYRLLHVRGSHHYLEPQDGETEKGHHSGIPVHPSVESC